MATSNAVPDNSGITLTVGSLLGSNIAPPLTQKFIPTNPDGTVFDCSAYDGTLSLYVYFPGFDLNQSSGSVPGITKNPSNDAHDATGLTITIAETDCKTLQQFMSGQGTVIYTLVAADAGNTIKAMIGQGTLNLNLVP